MRARPVLLALAALLAVPAQAQYFSYGKNKVQHGAPDWRVLQSEHFDVLYYEPEARAPGGRVLATFAAEAAEDAYREVSVLFGTDLARRVPLLVYPTHATFAVTNAADLPVFADGIGGVTELYKNRVVIPFTGDWRDFRRVVHHELVHAVVNDVYYGGSVQSLVRSGLRLQIPGWFNEGLAEYSAQGWDTQSDLYVRDAILHDALADIPRLRGYFAYRGGQGVWDFVAEEYGREKVTEILERLRVGRSVAGAFRQATGLSLQALSERWRQTLRTVYFPEAAAREPIDAVARPLATPDVTGAGYHASPALSPQGDRVAYVASTDGLFDVYVLPTVGRALPRKLVDGQTTRQFEALRLLSPGLAWSPDGARLAIAVTSGGADAVVILDPETGRVEREVRPEGVDAIRSVAWSPDGARLALAGTAGAHSDLFVVDLDRGRTVNLTRDLFSDHAPVWAPDGRSLYFHSDRGDALILGRTTAAAADAGRVDLGTLGRASLDLYRVAVPEAASPEAASPEAASPEAAERLTDDAVWDETDAAVSTDASGRVRLLFVSDRNGIPNLYEKDLETGVERPLTDLQSGALRATLSADGSRAAVLALDRGVPSVYLARDPFGRSDLPAALVPTVWAQRRTGETAVPAPALRLASDLTRQRNALLRDAADGLPPAAPPRRPRPPSPAALARADSILAWLMASSPPGLLAVADSLGGAGLVSPDGRGFAVDYRDYRFSDAFDEGLRSRSQATADPFQPVGHRDSTGALVARRYRLRFTPDLIAASGGYDTVYGLQSVTRLLFSDLLGNHRIGIATNLVLDLRNADYLLSYQTLARRTDFALETFHLARELPDFQNGTVYRYRNYGVVGAARYPLDTFRRVDAEVGLLGVSLTDLSAIGTRPRTRRFVVPKLSFTHDATVPGRLGPQSGARYAASVSGTPGPDARFGTALVDARRYWTFGQTYAVAVRGSAGLSLGPDPQRFFAAGVQNWLGASYDSLPVEGPDDFVFATPVLPLRGFGYNEAAGDRFALVNVEARVPLVAALLPGPLPVAVLYDVQAVGFLDAGIVADGDVDWWRDPTDPATGERLPRVFDDVLLGAGAGLRTVAFGAPVRLDWAWPFDGRQFGAARLYVSVGLDF